VSTCFCRRILSLHLPHFLFHFISLLSQYFVFSRAFCAGIILTYHTQTMLYMHFLLYFILNHMFFVPPLTKVTRFLSLAHSAHSQMHSPNEEKKEESATIFCVLFLEPQISFVHTTEQTCAIFLFEIKFIYISYNFFNFWKIIKKWKIFFCGQSTKKK
jgi:hypothetical protein